jgi:hypothetical protein
MATFGPLPPDPNTCTNPWAGVTRNEKNCRIHGSKDRLSDGCDLVREERDLLLVVVKSLLDGSDFFNGPELSEIELLTAIRKLASLPGVGASVLVRTSFRGPPIWMFQKVAKWWTFNPSRQTPGFSSDYGHNCHLSEEGTAWIRLSTSGFTLKCHNCHCAIEARPPTEDDCPSCGSRLIEVEFSSDNSTSATEPK